MQFRFLIEDVNRILGKQKLRIVFIVFSRTFCGVFLYRLERSFYLFFGDKWYKILRLFLLPLYYPIAAYSNVDIHYKANIGGGLLILHPSLRAVISGKCTAGKNLTLVGGNCIGIKNWYDGASFLIGDNCTLGANSTIIGPLTLCNNVTIGASACVVKSFNEEGITLVGVPAKKVI